MSQAVELTSGGDAGLAQQPAGLRLVGLMPWVLSSGLWHTFAPDEDLAAVPIPGACASHPRCYQAQPSDDKNLI